MRLISILAVVLACAACQSQPNPMAPAGATTAVEPPANQPSCTSYTVPVTVGGQQEQSVVESCQQPDGSWRITQNTPGLPPQVYVVPPPTQYPSGYPYSDYYTYPFYYPYWAAEPWFFGLGPTIVLAQRFPHFHHGFGHGFHGGFAHGFHSGSAHGFHGHGGFGGGFVAGHGGGGHR
jgi:surface antigen